VWVGYRYLICPLQAPADDLSLALRIESEFPSLKDALASTVQFLEQSDVTADSPELRHQVVQNTLRRVAGVEFTRVIATRGLPLGAISIFAAALLMSAAFFHFPAEAWTALERLVNPFGDRDWPRQTQIDLQYPSRIAKGEPFEVHAELYGVIPGHGTVEFEGLTPGNQISHVTIGTQPNWGTLVVRRERVEKSFRFQVRAHDALSGWRDVTVLPPPMLVPLRGRPSPQVHLRFPSYTDLPEQDLPDGTGNIEAVAGTQVTLSAALDRSVANAWIEFRPDQPLIRTAAFLGPMGLTHPLPFLASFVGGQSVWSQHPIPLDPTGTILNVGFRPAITGTYALRFVDATGLTNTRLFDLRIFRDPKPVVTLERPAAIRDSLDVLPGADITVSAFAEDRLFAIRSIVLEYRCGLDGPPRKLTLYDHCTFGDGIGELLSGLSFSGNPQTRIRLRPQHLQISGRLSLHKIRHEDGSPLREGDIVKLQVSADDFDDVALDKEPGRSHEIELHVVDPSTLELNLTKAQAQIQQEMVRLRKMQQEAINHVIGPEQQWRNTSRLRDPDIDQVFQAEQLQQQIRSRVGDPQDSLQQDVGRVLQSIKDNHLPHSGMKERMETAAAELKRLENNELTPIEQGLNEVRRHQQNSGSEAKMKKANQGPLSEVRQHQEEVETTLGELLQLLEPSGSANEIQAEARALLLEQKKLEKDGRALDEQNTRGQTRDNLNPNQKASLDKLAEFQHKLGGRAAELVGKMERLSNELQERDADTAEAMQTAAQNGRENDVAGHMRKAGDRFRENQLGDAAQSQQHAIKSMESLVRSLEEKREKEMERLRKKLKEAEQKLSEITRRQHELRKKIVQAGEIANPETRQQELQRLAREQQQISKEIHELVRELTRLRSEPARLATSAARESMTRAARQMDRNEDSAETQEETLDHLQEARRALKTEMAEVEEELAHEKLAKIADTIKRLRDRQESFVTEADRIQQEALRRQVWNRALLSSLNDLGENQRMLAEEADGLANGKLSGTKVFSRILTKSAEQMKLAAEAIQKQFTDARETPEKPEPQTAPANFQREAILRIDQLLEALKPETGAGGRSRQQAENPGNAGRKTKADGDGIGVLAQLKGLRILQQELNDRTDAFGKNHPDPAKLTQKEKGELEILQKEQQEIEHLLEDVTRENDVEGASK
jgi:hypothetical protein